MSSSSFKRTSPDTGASPTPDSPQNPTKRVRLDGKQPKPKKGVKNAGKRRRAAASGDKTLEEPRESRGPRLGPKRATALLIGFCGSKYRGMQFQHTPDNPGLKTIEGELFAALIRAGAVSQDNAEDPVKVNLARAARTDAGVHAAGNVVSLKMVTNIPAPSTDAETDAPDATPPPPFDPSSSKAAMLERINAELPSDIRVWDFLRVQNSFNARTHCDSRKYTYFFPSYLLIPKSHTSPTLAEKRAYRATEDDLTGLRYASKYFLGTHNFYNFTVGKESSDRSCSRFMKSIDVGEPKVHGEGDTATEWIGIGFWGQSFMLHQIRKMMFALLMTARSKTPPEIIVQMYSPKNPITIPKMPALGLLLEFPVFAGYSQKVAETNEKLGVPEDELPNNDQYRPPIDFQVYAKEMEQFKDEMIYRSMRGVEASKGLFDAWIRDVDEYDGAELNWLNGSGEIPPECIFSPGSKRKNPFREKREFDRTAFLEGVDAVTSVDEAQEEEEKNVGDEMDG